MSRGSIETRHEIYFLEQRVSALEEKITASEKRNKELNTKLDLLVQDVEHLKRQNKSTSEYINMLQTPTLNDLT